MSNIANIPSGQKLNEYCAGTTNALYTYDK